MTSLQRRLALTLGFTQLLAWGTTYYIPATMAGPIADELDTSRTIIFGAFSWAVLIAGFCAPAIGRSISSLDNRAKAAGFSKLKRLGKGEYEKQY